MQKKDKTKEILSRWISDTYLEFFDFDENLSESENKEKMLEFADKLTKNGLFICIDHTKKLLKNARSFLKQKDLEIAALFYATYFEHQINSLIERICIKKGVFGEDTKQILRETAFRAKCTWLLKILDLAPVASNHLKVMTQVFEIRNSFVHYKWQAYDIDSDYEIKEQLKITKILEEAEKSVIYLQRRINKQIHQDKKRRAKTVAKSLIVL
jgi:hypothetical protein